MLNPIVFAENVTTDFLRYQLTTYSFADDVLQDQFKKLVSLKESRKSPLMKGPYISLSGSFRSGAHIGTLIEEGILNEKIENLLEYKILYAHQEKAVREIIKGNSLIISTGTGSGKTESFLIPIIHHCLGLKDIGEREGIRAVLVYPMNALAEDQMVRIRSYLAGTGIPFGIYTGITPESDPEVGSGYLDKVDTNGPRGRERFLNELEIARKEGSTIKLVPSEERLSRDSMRKDPPRILVTNVKQLEYLLTRTEDIELFDEAALDYLVFDEAHTFRGAMGAETATLIRRLRTFRPPKLKNGICIAASATVADPKGTETAPLLFASRFFGIPQEKIRIIQEEYVEEDWKPNRKFPPALNGSLPKEILNDILESISDDPEKLKFDKLNSAFGKLSGYSLRENEWQKELYDYLRGNEVLYQLAQILKKPKAIDVLPEELKKSTGISITEEEVLCWLALGVASRNEEKPVVRPIAHVFLQGMGSSVVTFDSNDDKPKLWLKAEDREKDPHYENRFPLPVSVCTKCGQHYYEHFLEDIHFEGGVISGGGLYGDVNCFSHNPEIGKIVTLVDRLVGGREEPEDSKEVFFCSICGGVHLEDTGKCELKSCNVNRLNRLLLILPTERGEEFSEGKLSSCLVCKAKGKKMFGSYRSPARPLRATTVADVHILAQNIIQHSEKKRLLVFSDNRQDAAFQAGWMKDHARRRKLRGILFSAIKEGNTTIEAAVNYIVRFLDENETLSRKLIPEIWRIFKNFKLPDHINDREKFITIQVLREITTDSIARNTLQKMGMILVKYKNLEENQDWIQDKATEYRIDFQILKSGIENILDTIRRKGSVYDEKTRYLSDYFFKEHELVKRGYIQASFAPPKGVQFETGPDEKWVFSFSGSKSANVNFIKKWELNIDDDQKFIKELWEFLLSAKILTPVVLKDGNGKRSTKYRGNAYQIDMEGLLLEEGDLSYYQCDKCGKIHFRGTPNNSCSSYRCDGYIDFKTLDLDNYEYQQLHSEPIMLLAEEHSAQISKEDRDYLEREFKQESGDKDRLNTLVCTSTLEMGVDIGGLDSVLMRNVPPLPANYWQRAGRAGRRFRIAVNFTYSRQASHDRAYFQNPEKLLEGLVEPPSFNLKNEEMIRKHIHSTILTTLFEISQGKLEYSIIPEEDRLQLGLALKNVIPKYIKTYIFHDNNDVLDAPKNIQGIHVFILKYKEYLLDKLHKTFYKTWPEEFRYLVENNKLVTYITEMQDMLQDVINSLWKRVRWIMEQLERIGEIEKRKGTLESDDKIFRDRANKTILRLRSTGRTIRGGQAEGIDDNMTYSVLAAEGFLPGYGLEVGQILASYSKWSNASDEDNKLRRAPLIAIREFIPGNMIYVKGNQYTPRFFELYNDQPISIKVDTKSKLVIDTTQDKVQGYQGISNQLKDLKIIPICNTILYHQSSITDSEDTRFQLPVFLVGSELNRHGRGKKYRWGSTNIHSINGYRIRLINAGATVLVESGGDLGYPICLNNGMALSPFKEDEDLDKWNKLNQERNLGNFDRYGFYTESAVDVILFDNLRSEEEAYSVAESFRIAASNLLEMELDDLQILYLGASSNNKSKSILYDPMPGGSGLIEQIIDKWESIIKEVERVVSHCPSDCGTSCIDCMQTFRNAHYHRFLNRNLVIPLFGENKYSLKFLEDIAETMQVQEISERASVNDIRELILKYIQDIKIHENKEILIEDLNEKIVVDLFIDNEAGNSDGFCNFIISESEELQRNDSIINKYSEELRNLGYVVNIFKLKDFTNKNLLSRFMFKVLRPINKETAEYAQKEINGDKS